jgi:hypothetical protein
MSTISSGAVGALGDAQHPMFMGEFANLGAGHYRGHG